VNLCAQVKTTQEHSSSSL